MTRDEFLALKPGDRIHCVIGGPFGEPPSVLTVLRGAEMENYERYSFSARTWVSETDYRIKIIGAEGASFEHYLRAGVCQFWEKINVAPYP